MSYDLAVWMGPRPTTSEVAEATYERQMDLLEELLDSDAPAPAPDTGIVAFVEAALARYPELTELSGPECPWASAPLLDEAVGDFIHFPLTFAGAEFARDELAEIAASLGLVCYDPQIERLLPDNDAAPASKISAHAYAALGENRSGRSGPIGWLRRLFASAR